MKKTMQLRLLASAVVLPALALTGCSEDEPGGGDNQNGSAMFVFATSTQTSAGTSNVLVTGESLDEGDITILGQGLTNEGATQWLAYKNTFYALQYNQGNDGTTRSYVLGSDGKMVERSKRYSITRFSSYGTYEDDIITMSTGSGPADQADEKGNIPMTLLVTYLNVKDQTATTNNTADGKYSMEDYVGNGEYATLAGLAQVDKKIYAGVVPMGLSPYGSANPDNIREGYGDLVKTESGGTGGGSYTAGTLSGTQYPDECWVAIYDNKDLLNPKFAHTDKISSPCGRYRSQYYQTVWPDDNGDIYVFSSSYAVTMTDARQQTKLPAGVCRIRKGQTTFDDSYYVNIEAQTPGKNRSFMRCWPAGGSYFLMAMYDGPLTATSSGNGSGSGNHGGRAGGGATSGPAATELAIFNAATGTLTYVTGLPAEVESIGKDVYVQNGKVYIPVNVANQTPAIYGITCSSATATKGVSIDATSVTGMGYLTPAL